jgi:hypothetical protein
MEIINSILTWALKKRIVQIEHFIKHPHDVQEELRQNLLKDNKNTDYGKKFGFDSIQSRSEFQSKIPLVTYEQIFPYVEKMMAGEQNVLWHSKVTWFAKSSGTTNARSKFIPVSNESMEDCHYKGGKDLLSIYINNRPETKIFTGKGLAIGGSNQINQYSKESPSYYGDVSAVILKNLPLWAQFVRTPSLDIALMDEWEAKIEKMAEATSREDVTSISGVPTWTYVLLKRILELQGKDNILEVWPNLELFVHGAVAFSPYEELFKSLIPSDGMYYLETYNASEGFFGIQDRSDSKEMLLMLDYGIYYEFIPFLERDDDHPTVLSLDQIELEVNYAMVVTTNGGLWRYKIGDTIKFTSKNPYRIKITGRTKHYINAFGEELIIENAEAAITEACLQSDALVSNFTAAPRYIGDGKKGGHEWIIEFEKKPTDADVFINALDRKLREVNSDYDAKRYKDIALELPKVHFVTKGTFHNWMKKRGKLGGQNKVPRLANTREYLDEILLALEVGID